MYRLPWETRRGDLTWSEAREGFLEEGVRARLLMNESISVEYIYWKPPSLKRAWCYRGAYFPLSVQTFYHLKFISYLYLVPHFHLYFPVEAHLHLLDCYKSLIFFLSVCFHSILSILPGVIFPKQIISFSCLKIFFPPKILVCYTNFLKRTFHFPSCTFYSSHWPACGFFESVFIF